MSIKQYIMVSIRNMTKRVIGFLFILEKRKIETGKEGNYLIKSKEKVIAELKRLR